MKMRELETRTGVSRQMIQFYFKNGMLPDPERPKRNVAIYNENHVNAILSIRQLQSEGRLSIEEIKQFLAGNTNNKTTRAAVFTHLDELFAAHAGVDLQLVPLSSIKSRNPQAEQDAPILQQVGAIELIERNGELHLSHVDAQIIGCWGDMRAAGYTEEDGFGPDIVSAHVESAEKLANAEVDIFLSHVPADYPTEKKATMAQAGAKVMLDLFTLLRMKATIAAFGRIDSPQS
jgi:DNA-binding transcriptional MerR regulator